MGTTRGQRTSSEAARLRTIGRAPGATRACKRVSPRSCRRSFASRSGAWPTAGDQRPQARRLCARGCSRYVRSPVWDHAVTTKGISTTAHSKSETTAACGPTTWGGVGSRASTPLRLAEHHIPCPDPRTSRLRASRPTFSGTRLRRTPRSDSLSISGTVAVWVG